jgi:hypothetical protein
LESIAAGVGNGEAVGWISGWLVSTRLLQVVGDAKATWGESTVGADSICGVVFCALIRSTEEKSKFRDRE